MNLYVDDNRVDRRSIAALRAAGHTLVLPAGVGLPGVSDPRHLAYAIGQSLVVLTGDHEDFQDLHDLLQTAGGHHAGIIVVLDEVDRSKNMRPHQIVRALSNLEQSGLTIANDYVVLNHWR